MDYISVFPLNIYYSVLTHMSSGTILYQQYAGELISTENKILDKLQKVEAAIEKGNQ